MFNHHRFGGDNGLPAHLRINHWHGKKLLVITMVAVIVGCLGFVARYSLFRANDVYAVTDTGGTLTDLKAAVLDAYNVNSTDYTMASWLPFSHAVSAAEVLIKNNETSTDKLSQAKDDIVQAKKSLIVATTEQPSGNRLDLPCIQSGKNATGPKAQQFCWIDWGNLPMTSGTYPVRISVVGGHIDADIKVDVSNNASLFTRDDANYMVPYHLARAYDMAGYKTLLGFEGKDNTETDRGAIVEFTSITAVPDKVDGHNTTLGDWSMAFGDAESMSGTYGTDKYEQTVLVSDKPINKLGMVSKTGDLDESHSYGILNQGWGTNRVTIAGGNPNLTVPYAESAGSIVTTTNQPSKYRVEFTQYNRYGKSAIAVGVYMPYITVKHNIKFTSDLPAGDSSMPSSQKVDDGAQVKRPTGWTEGDTQIVPGYRFIGWYIKNQNDQYSKYDFDQPVSDDLVLYARWERVDESNNTPTDPDSNTGSGNESGDSNNNDGNQYNNNRNDSDERQSSTQTDELPTAPNTGV